MTAGNGNSVIWQRDCLDKLPLIPDGSVDMVFADLPYGVTGNKWDTVVPFAPLWEQLLRVGKKNAAFVFTATQPFATALINSQPKLFRYDLVWEKNNPAGFLHANKMPMRCHESILVFYRKLPTYHPQKTQGKRYVVTKGTGNISSGCYGTFARTDHAGTERHPRSVLTFGMPEHYQDRAGNVGRNVLHPTQKPLALLEWLVRTYTNEGETVLDPTCGSGTTGVACINTGRKFIGIEMDAGYVETTLRRMREAAGVAVPEPKATPPTGQLKMWGAA